MGTPATTSEVLATTAPAPGVVLGHDGLGVVALGASVDEVWHSLSETLGFEPDHDTGAPHAGKNPSTYPYFSCPGTFRRGVRWGGLTVIFTEGPTLYSNGKIHAFWWIETEVDAAGGDRDLRLVTADGIGRSSTVSAVRAAYGPRATITPGDDQAPARFEVLPGGNQGRLYGSLTGTSDDDTVTKMAGGDPCPGIS